MGRYFCAWAMTGALAVVAGQAVAEFGESVLTFDEATEVFAEFNEQGCPIRAPIDVGPGLADLLAILDGWGSTGAWDLDGDGVVGVSDLIEVLESWDG